MSPEEKKEAYPVLIEKIELPELVNLNETYHEQNNGLICSTLNEYGLTGFSRVLFPNNVNPCLNRIEVKQELKYDNSYLDLVKESLVFNSEYTGVTDSRFLSTKEISSLEGCTICEGPDINNVPLQWKFVFQPQQINGIEVSNTEIVVFMDVNGVNRIWGNWYNAVDPGFIEYGSNHARNAVIGLRLRYANERNQMFEQEILPHHIKENPLLRFTQIEVEAGLEIHKVWEVNLLQENTDIVRWKALISTVNGEILDTKVL